MLKNVCLLSAAVLLLRMPAAAQEVFRVMEYNVENLFDCRHDSLKQDGEFLPGSPRQWTPDRYNKKLENIAEVIFAAGGGQVRAPAGAQAGSPADTQVRAQAGARGAPPEGKASGKPNAYQQEMPGEGVYGEGGVAVMHAAGVAEGKYPAQQAEIHEESAEGVLQAAGAKPGQDEADIHGHAAQLERKIPPVVAAAIQKERYAPLLPQLAGGHQDAAGEEKAVEGAHVGQTPGHQITSLTV